MEVLGPWGPPGVCRLLRTGEATAKRCKESKHKTGSALIKLNSCGKLFLCHNANLLERNWNLYISIYNYIYIYTIEIAAVFFSSVHSFKQHEAAGLNLEKFDQVWRSKTITKGWWGWMWKGVEGAIWICVAFQPSETTCQNRKRSCTEYRRNPWVLNAAKMRTLWRVLKRAVTREDMWQWPSTFCWSIPWFWRKWRSDSSTSGPKTHWPLLQQLWVLQSLIYVA